MSTEFSSAFSFKPGEKIGGYDILEVFEPGGFAFAGKARAANGRTVFFKKYKRPGGSSPWLSGFVAYQTELKSRIEASPAKSLCYEFIEFFERSKPKSAVPLRVFYQVFEWIEGGTDLRKALDAAKKSPATLSWQQRVIFSRVLMAGINAIHKAGVIHTDLKPENLYLIPDAAVTAKFKLRLIDMDFSLLDGQQAPWHGAEGYVGTPGYMSPEHLRGKVPTKPSDIFTCGLMLGELLGQGHPAAGDMDAYEQRAQAGSLKPIELQQAVEGVADTEFLSFLVNACLRPEPGQRPTAEQLLLALNGRLAEWDGRRAVSSTTVLPPAPPPPPPPRPPVPPPPPPLRPPVPPPPPPRPPAPPPPAPPPPPPAVRTGVLLSGPGEHQRSANIETTFGRSVFKAWGPDYELYMSPEQFRVFKDAAGQWSIAHCSGAKNATNVDGSPLSAPVPLRCGMRVTLGKTGKCPVTLNLR